MQVLQLGLVDELPIDHRTVAAIRRSVSVQRLPLASPTMRAWWRLTACSGTQMGAVGSRPMMSSASVKTYAAWN